MQNTLSDAKFLLSKRLVKGYLLVYKPLARILQVSLEKAATVRETWENLGFLAYDRRGLLTWKNRGY